MTIFQHRTVLERRRSEIPQQPHLRGMGREQRRVQRQKRHTSASLSRSMFMCWIWLLTCTVSYQSITWSHVGLMPEGNMIQVSSLQLPDIAKSAHFTMGAVTEYEYEYSRSLPPPSLSFLPRVRTELGDTSSHPSRIKNQAEHPDQ